MTPTKKQLWTRLRDYHFDGLRVDAVHAIIDTSAVHFLEEMVVRAQDLSAAGGRELLLIAESDLNDPRVVRPRELGGHGMDSVWNEDFHHSLHAVLTGERQGYYEDFGSISDIAQCLERGVVYDGRYSRFRLRRHGRPHIPLLGRNFVGFLQNHDQVGNRAFGERSAALMSLGRLKIGAALVLGAPFMPMLFQGEEWAASTPFLYFTDHKDPALGAAVRKGRRAEFAAFGWRAEAIPDPQDPATFERSKLQWSEVEESPQRLAVPRYQQHDRPSALQAAYRAEQPRPTSSHDAPNAAPVRDRGQRLHYLRAQRISVQHDRIDPVQPPKRHGVEHHRTPA